MTPGTRPAYPLELTTRRLRIRSPEADDAPALNEAIIESLSELRPWMPWAREQPDVADTRANCEKAVAAFRDGEDYRLHIFEREGGRLVGSSGLHRADWSVPRVEIGYWLRTSCTGRGYITEAVAAITRYAFQQLGVQRVEIHCSDLNERSWRVAERLGFTLEGILRRHERHLDGSLRDGRIYSMLSEESHRLP